MLRSLPIAALILVAPLSQAAAQSVLIARGSWAALRFGARCEAAARPLPPAANREPQARAGFAFGQGRNGALFVRLSRGAREGSSVLLTVGEQPFLLIGRGAWAWSRGSAQDQALIAAMRSGRSMRIEARDRSGRRFSDRYLLAGAPTAIDAAAAACAGKM